MFSYENLNANAKKDFHTLKQEGIFLAQKLLQEVKVWKESPVKDNKKALEAVQYFEETISTTEKKKNESVRKEHEEYDRKTKAVMSELQTLIEKLTEDFNHRVRKLEKDNEEYLEKIREKHYSKLVTTEEQTSGYIRYLETGLKQAKEKYEDSKTPVKPKTLQNAEFNWNKFLTKWEERFDGINCPISVPYDTEKIVITEEIPLTQIIKEEPKKEKVFTYREEEPVKEKKSFKMVMSQEEEEMYQENPEARERWERIRREEQARVDKEYYSKVEPPPAIPKPKKLKKTVPKRETTVGQGVATYQIPLTQQKKYDSDED